MLRIPLKFGAQAANKFHWIEKPKLSEKVQELGLTSDTEVAIVEGRGPITGDQYLLVYPYTQTTDIQDAQQELRTSEVTPSRVNYPYNKYGPGCLKDVLKQLQQPVQIQFPKKSL